MKVLVTGVKGQLGFDVVNELKEKNIEAVGVDIEEMDITDKFSVNKVIEEVNPDAVIHCAAWTAVDAAENEDKKEKENKKKTKEREMRADSYSDGRFCKKITKKRLTFSKSMI